MIRLRRPAVHWPTVRSRPRADAGPLLLTGIVVAVVVLFAGAVPPLIRATADDAVQDAVHRAGDDAAVRVHAQWEPDTGPGGGRVRDPYLAEAVDDLRGMARDELGSELRSVLRPPVATVSSSVLKITDGSVQRTFQLNYLGSDPAGGGPGLTWIAGGAPRPAVPEVESRIEVPYGGPPWPVQVGLSKADADALGVGPGDRIPVVDQRKREKHILVSGVFQPTDSDDPAWQLAPWLLGPVSGVDGVGSTRLAGLLSAESLPDARLAFPDEELERVVWFDPDPEILTRDSAEAVAATVVALKTLSASSGVRDSSLRWETRFDAVLRQARIQVGAATAQASVLLVGILTVAVLVLVLAADLLVRRRSLALTAARQRGAALPDLASELLIESTLVTLLAAVAGLGLVVAVAPGISWRWAAPVLLAAAVAAPMLGTLTAARATRDRRVPANRGARRWIRRTGQLRRATLEVAVLVAAVAAFTALHQRGILPAVSAAPTGPGPGEDGGVALPASAPALGALTGALVLLRLLPLGTRLALRHSLRSRRPLAVFGAARAAVTSARVLPLLVLVTSVALASFALTLRATAVEGLAEGAWRTVGADARLDVSPAGAASTAALAQRIAAAPGVRQVVAAQVIDGARLAVDSTLVAPRLVIVDAAALARLRAATPLPGGPELDRLAVTGAAPGSVPALVRSADGRLRSGTRMELRREDGPSLQLAVVGAAPAVGDADDVVIVDAAAIAAAGVPVVPNTVWAAGPGAGRAVADSAVAADVVVREDVLAQRRTAPLSAGLLRLWAASIVMFLAMGLLGLALGAAAGAPERWQTLTRLRTLGVRPTEARRIAVGELLPPVVVAAVGGPLLGVVLAGLTIGPLALRLLTLQVADSTLVLPWWEVGLLSVALLVAVVVVVQVEFAVRRHRRLGEVLRAGEG
ncbi:ABC transporter permease [Plantactinospora soyae]|uniref:ABC transport system permease protein n=1 Tax=Plantactinospora soyae TaxID=1544732 RepID=A0A927RAJ4_9ACTN|nr:ABC transporter permease [Plantactinospora soyae]MBE1490801.1 putative ABC transport system permease protein [Plantactinospora soyae]